MKTVTPFESTGSNVSNARGIQRNIIIIIITIISRDYTSLAQRKKNIERRIQRTAAE